MKVIKELYRHNLKAFVLTKSELKSQEELLLKTGVIKPQNISSIHFRKEILHRLNDVVLQRHKAAIIFTYNNKNYLITYNK